ncbi:MAG: hypothetical protein ACRCWY_04400 [Cellulosilyticaceae bacterium]
MESQKTCKKIHIEGLIQPARLRERCLYEAYTGHIKGSILETERNMHQVLSTMVESDVVKVHTLPCKNKQIVMVEVALHIKFLLASPQQDVFHREHIETIHLTQLVTKGDKRIESYILDGEVQRVHAHQLAYGFYYLVTLDGEASQLSLKETKGQGYREEFL